MAVVLKLACLPGPWALGVRVCVGLEKARGGNLYISEQL